MIGLFDSGFGGLTVLSSLLKRLPEYDYLYLGDSARAPYGNHSHENITQFTREGVEFLFKQGAKLVILACNSASSNALRVLQEEMIRQTGIKDKNILGVVVPIAEAAAESGARKIVVIGTRATVGSGVYERELESRIEGAFDFIGQACPLLVPLIEEGYAHKMETKRILKQYLRLLKQACPDILVPACTHYPLLQKDIVRIMGKRTKILDTGEIVAEKLANYLERHTEIESGLSRKGRRQFFTTERPEHFAEQGSLFLGEKIERVELVKLG